MSIKPCLIEPYQQIEHGMVNQNSKGITFVRFQMTLGPHAVLLLTDSALASFVESFLLLHQLLQGALARCW